MSARLDLRPVLREDAADPAVVGWHTDLAGYALMNEEPRTPEQAREMLDAWAAAWEADGFGYWIAEKAGQPVGIGGVRRLAHEGADYLNLYYRTDPAARGRGVGLQIARAGTAYAAEHQPHLRVLARIAPANTPSLATVARAGMVEVGPFRGPNDPSDKPAPISWESPVVRRGAPDAAGRSEMLDLTRDGAPTGPDDQLVRLFAPTSETWQDPTRTGALLGFGFVTGADPVIDPRLRGRGLDGVLLAALRARS